MEWEEGEHLVILVTGADGQLGKELTKKLAETFTVIGLGREEMDVSRKKDVDREILKFKPTIIVHAAAFTEVDQCEIDYRTAFEVNGLGTGYVAQAAEKVGARIIYISTDYVFDGQKFSPYFEGDVPNPQSIYGMSKLLGERFVNLLNKGTVVRTSWLYGHEGNNFVKTMLELSKNNNEIKVVADQIGTPTYVKDLVDTITKLLDKKAGIYHVSNSGSCSWYEFARAIMTEAGFKPEMVRPITTEEYGALAPRPRYSVLANQALINEKIKPLRTWNDALKEFIREEKGHD